MSTIDLELDALGERYFGDSLDATWLRKWCVRRHAKQPNRHALPVDRELEALLADSTATPEQFEALRQRHFTVLNPYVEWLSQSKNYHPYEFQEKAFGYAKRLGFPEYSVQDFGNDWHALYFELFQLIANFTPLNAWQRAETEVRQKKLTRVIALCKELAGVLESDPPLMLPNAFAYLPRAERDLIANAMCRHRFNATIFGASFVRLSEVSEVETYDSFIPMTFEHINEDGSKEDHLFNGCKLSEFIRAISADIAAVSTAPTVARPNVENAEAIRLAKYLHHCFTIWYGKPNVTAITCLLNLRYETNFDETQIREWLKYLVFRGVPPSDSGETPLIFA